MSSSEEKYSLAIRIIGSVIEEMESEANKRGYSAHKYSYAKRCFEEILEAHGGPDFSAKYQAIVDALKSLVIAMQIEIMESSGAGNSWELVQSLAQATLSSLGEPTQDPYDQLAERLSRK